MSHEHLLCMGRLELLMTFWDYKESQPKRTKLSTECGRAVSWGNNQKNTRVPNNIIKAMD